MKHAIRSLLRSPGFTVAAIVTLALGIGANTAIWSVVDGVLLRPSPFHDLDRLMMVWETDRASNTTREPASIPDFVDYRRDAKQLAGLAAFLGAEVSLTPDAGEPARLAAVLMTHDLAPLLGLKTLVGRTFLQEEDLPGAPRVAMISEAVWEAQFARDPNILERTVRLNDIPHAIVGVLADQADFGILQLLRAADYSRGFADRGGRTRVDAWLPLRADPARADRGNHPILMVGRLKPEATRASAQREIETLAAELERLYPQANDRRGANIEPVGDLIFGPVRPALLALLGAVVLVLLMACANVANLLLARGSVRAREVTVRAALGAGSGRLLRQFFAESALLSVTGAAFGMVLAWAGQKLLLSLAPAGIPRVEQVGIDGRVLIAALVLTLAVTLVAGIVPAFQARRFGLAGALQSDTARTGSAGRAHRRARSMLVVAELALAVILMVGAGLLIRSLWSLQQVDPGFRARGLIKAEFQLPASRYPQNFNVFPRWPEVTRFSSEVTSRLKAIPGVLSVTIASNHPLDAGFTSSISVVGREGEAGDWPEPAIRRIDAGYVSTLQTPLLAGRAFALSDDPEAPPVVLINQASRERYFGGGNPLGQRINLWGAQREVIGVIGDERIRGRIAAAPPAVYLPHGQAPVAGGSIVVRTSGAPLELAPAIRRIVRELDPALPVYGVEPLEVTLANSAGQLRFTMLVLGAFAGVALLLALVGVHGVMSYTVAQRTRELGIRMALGADKGAVRSLVLGQGAALAAIGLGLGLLGALGFSRILTTLLYGIGSGDPVTIAGVLVILGAVTLLASWLPARRASRLDPVIALRTE